ncbi:DsrE family protein [Stakelama marina]|uniref:DsrE family protein n=1 Tax=Stakelama marina TaxID=2826939 RepID=A0A8T4IDD7_9SPHN|nr:DsrE family protein [Stakelama marina]MBR0552590.1 DsrE family protein [Stakelama marina]
MKKLMLSAAIAAASIGAAQAQSWETPVIKGYGKIMDYKDVAVRPDPKLDYKLVYGIHDDKMKGGVNATLWSIARNVNLLRAGGVPKDKIHIVAVFYGPGIGPALGNEAFKALAKGKDKDKDKDVGDNPNLGLMKQLSENGVEFYACGQTMASKKLTAADLNAYTKKSLSAQVVLANYQLNGYALMAN